MMDFNRALCYCKAFGNGVIHPVTTIRDRARAKTKPSEMTTEQKLETAGAIAIISAPVALYLSMKHRIKVLEDETAKLIIISETWRHKNEVAMATLNSFCPENLSENERKVLDDCRHWQNMDRIFTFQ